MIYCLLSYLNIHPQYQVHMCDTQLDTVLMLEKYENTNEMALAMLTGKSFFIDMWKISGEPHINKMFSYLLCNSILFRNLLPFCDAWPVFGIIVVKSWCHPTIQSDVYAYCLSILIKHESCQFVCLVTFFSATKSLTFMKFGILAHFAST